MAKALNSLITASFFDQRSYCLFIWQRDDLAMESVFIMLE
jgi:hypothetical protein